MNNRDLFLELQDCKAELAAEKHRYEIDMLGYGLLREEIQKAEAEVERLTGLGRDTPSRGPREGTPRARAPDPRRTWSYLGHRHVSLGWSKAAGGPREGVAGGFGEDRGQSQYPALRDRCRGHPRGS